MNAVASTTLPLYFTVPVPENIRVQARAWIDAHSEITAMALWGDEARFADPRLADQFADEMGKLKP
ncbi:MAG TPA: hypothetical protein VK196_03100 [Magnetospirillum sp.]|nr:hypothetical protein [Magnetospirillum sp.]